VSEGAAVGSLAWWRTFRAANRRYREVFGRRPDLLLARRHSERVQRAKLFQRDPRLPILGDKIAAKAFIADRVGPEFVVPTLYAGDALPPRSDRTWQRPFFVKASAASGWQVRVPADGSPHWRRLERQVDRWLGSTYGERGGEWHYARMPRRILVEPHLGDPEMWPDDYKIWVFHGRVHYIHWLTGRSTSEFGGRYMNRQWRPAAFRSLVFPTLDTMPPRPESFDLMLWIAEELARDFTFLRVDMYEVDGRPYVGELTFTPTAGYHRYDPPDTDLMLGRLWRKPRRPRFPAAPYPAALHPAGRPASPHPEPAESAGHLLVDDPEDELIDASLTLLRGH
jgi:hypothetical protein